jgi:hypothetical protein
MPPSTVNGRIGRIQRMTPSASPGSKISQDTNILADQYYELL